jgi:integrase
VLSFESRELLVRCLASPISLADLPQRRPGFARTRKPRSVPIIDWLAVLLVDHFVLLDHPSEGLIFPNPKNADWPTNAGILRHRRPEPQDPSTYLGHATITLTLDRYGHLMPESEVEARALLDAYLA